MGRFELKNIKTGTYQLTVSAIGFEEIKKTNTIDADKDLGVLTLVEQSQALEEVVVKAQKPLFEQQIDRLVVNVQENVTTAGGTALDVLERAPGVAVDRGSNSLGLNGKDGVQVMINGKISRQAIAAIMQILGGMSANNIEKIELITNPPAKYEAEGNAGIINIQMAKSTDLGTNGAITAHLGYGIHEKAGMSINLNHRKKQWNFYGDASYSWERKDETFTNDRTIRNTSETLFSNSVSDREPTNANLNAKLGLDYQLSDQTILGAFITGFTNVWDMDSQGLGFDASTVAPAVIFEVETREYSKGHHLMGNVNLNHKIGDHADINFDIDYLWYDNSTQTDYQNVFSNVVGMEMDRNIIVTEKSTPINVLVGRIDYSHKLSKKLKLESGLKGTSTALDNDVLTENRTTAPFVTEEDLSENSDLSEKIGAIYTSLTYEINTKTKMNIGLRYEYSETDLDLATQDDVVDLKISQLFPTFFFSRTVSKETTLQLSYGRRIRRPSFDDLAPFFIFINPTTFFFGNTQLKPSISDNIKFDIKYKKYLMSLEYNHQDNAIMRYQPIVLENNQQVFTSLNLKYNDTYNLIFSAPIKCNSWWNMNLSLMGIMRKLETLDNEKLDKSFARINLSKTFKLPEDFTLELSGFFQTESIFGLAGLSTYKSVGAGVQKTFKNDSKLRLNFNHLFDYDVFTGRDLIRNAFTNTNYRFEPHVFRLSYSIHPGNCIFVLCP